MVPDHLRHEIGAPVSVGPAAGKAVHGLHPVGELRPHLHVDAWPPLAEGEVGGPKMPERIGIRPQVGAIRNVTADLGQRPVQVVLTFAWIMGLNACLARGLCGYRSHLGLKGYCGYVWAMPCGCRNLPGCTLQGVQLHRCGRWTDWGRWASHRGRVEPDRLSCVARRLGHVGRRIYLPAKRRPLCVWRVGRPRGLRQPLCTVENAGVCATTTAIG
mmetsp:Transcript_62576/g.111535  ORF Transcript_62576/g.111535 Transcript_62576/m.111535 type:complete len:215 (-) Transcript_62576:121-765(-)